MARTIAQIFESIRGQAVLLATEKGLQSVVDMMNNTSTVAVWKVLFNAVAFGIWTLEKLFDLFRLEIDDRISMLKPHSARWYAEKAKAFQYGYPLVIEADYYDNTALNEVQIAASKIIKHSAVVEMERGIRIKVAKEVAGELAPLTVGELEAFVEYMESVKDAGIKLLITSTVADDLKASLRIFYNPLVLNGTGARIDGESFTPVQDAFKLYLKNLPFNGLFVPQLMIDHLQAVDGVVIVKDDLWQARYGALSFSGIDVEYVPDAGYLRLIQDGLTLTFIPHAVI